MRVRRIARYSAVMGSAFAFLALFFFWIGGWEFGSKHQFTTNVPPEKIYEALVDPSQCEKWMRDVSSVSTLIQNEDSEQSTRQIRESGDQRYERVEQISADEPGKLFETKFNTPLMSVVDRFEITPIEESSRKNHDELYQVVRRTRIQHYGWYRLSSPFQRYSIRRHLAEELARLERWLETGNPEDKRGQGISK
jgi:Polyketide cyclase / dehydrase and lipid transport